jgi:hypothetical protein
MYILLLLSSSSSSSSPVSKEKGRMRQIFVDVRTENELEIFGRATFIIPGVKAAGE